MGIATGGRHIALSHKLSEHSANESFTADSQEATTFNKWIMVKTVGCEAHTKKNNNVLHCVTFTTEKSKQLRNSSVCITEQLPARFMIYNSQMFCNVTFSNVLYFIWFLLHFTSY